MTLSYPKIKTKLRGDTKDKAEKGEVARGVGWRGSGWEYILRDYMYVLATRKKIENM